MKVKKSLSRIEFLRNSNMLLVKIFQFLGEDMKEFLNKILIKTSRIFNTLDDNIMANPIIEGQVHFT